MRTDATLRVKADPACIADARRLVDEQWTPLADVVDLHALRLLVSELVTNVIRHTDSGEGELRLLLDGETLRVEVEDHGPGVPTRPATPDYEKGGGFGLYLVQRLADRWGVRDGTCIWLEKNLTPVPEPALEPPGMTSTGRFRRRPADPANIRPAASEGRRPTAPASAARG